MKFDHEKIYNFNNLYQAYKASRRGKRGTREVIQFELEAGVHLYQLRQELKNETYQLSGYYHFTIYDDLAKGYFEKAITEIDESIRHLEKIKEYLTKSSKQLRLANDKAQDLSIKKLTQDNPTMRDEFEKAGIAIE